jgi:hypothetical protein
MTLAIEFARAAATRGMIDPVYRNVSDHLSRSMQRLYPVWVLAGPGLADPAHIELYSRTVYLDSDRLLGSRQEITDGALDAHRILVTFGAALHETFHARHTKLWIGEHNLTLAASDSPDDRQLAVDRTLLEEPRMEAHGVRAHDPAGRRGRFVRNALSAAVVDVILEDFQRQLLAAALTGRPVTRDTCGRAMTYLHARTHYGVIDPAVLGPLRGIWQQVLGGADMRALDDLYADLIWVADGDSDALTSMARRYRDIIGPPDPTSGDDEDDSGRAQDGDSGGDPGDGTDQDAGGGVSARSLADGLQAAREQQARQVQQASEARDEALRAAGQQTSTGDPQAADATTGVGVGAPTGRMPDRGVDRPPAPDEVIQARRYADRLRKALTVGTRRIDKRTPGGRFNGRAYARAQFERQLGRPVTSRWWTTQRNVSNPVREPHVGLVIDNSGSMGIHEYALGPIAWILTEGLRAVDGRLAIALFGNGMELLTTGRDPMRLVPGIRTGGGTAHGGDALIEVCRHLDMHDQTRPRFVYILSDGGWYDTHAGVQEIHRLRDLGVPTLHIAIGPLAPLSVDADRISVISDPADALDIVARDTVEALADAVRARRRR